MLYLFSCMFSCKQWNWRTGWLVSDCGTELFLAVEPWFCLMDVCTNHSLVGYLSVELSCSWLLNHGSAWWMCVQTTHWLSCTWLWNWDVLGCWTMVGMWQTVTSTICSKPSVCAKLIKWNTNKSSRFFSVSSPHFFKYIIKRLYKVQQLSAWQEWHHLHLMTSVFVSVSGLL